MHYLGSWGAYISRSLNHRHPKLHDGSHGARTALTPPRAVRDTANKFTVIAILSRFSTLSYLSLNTELCELVPGRRLTRWKKRKKPLKALWTKRVDSYTRLEFGCSQAKPCTCSGMSVKAGQLPKFPRRLTTPASRATTALHYSRRLGEVLLLPSFHSRS
ncbi:hypothetical protein CPB84DRAFT_1783633 [Gymnopilus junonius]|uniref:Uncharacterized protein n=1 Tax=Gymnopilus junonius TaxID=109634 RepID=A0A9P5NLB7_GYMJU|nr:hypothetical protein CPB84DRAFT_1783633 [Gymnopilus junonius]